VEEESDFITDSLSNGRALPVDVFAEPQDSAVNRGVVSPHPPSLESEWLRKHGATPTVRSRYTRKKARYEAKEH